MFENIKSLNSNLWCFKAYVKVEMELIVDSNVSPYVTHIHVHFLRMNIFEKKVITLKLSTSLGSPNQNKVSVIDYCFENRNFTAPLMDLVLKKYILTASVTYVLNGSQ